MGKVPIVSLQDVYLKTAVVYGITFLLVLPFFCRDLPFSKYFITTDDIANRALEINRQRVAAAEKYLLTLAKHDPLKMLPKSRRLRFAIGVVSVSRQTKTFSTQYLTQVMARLHEAVTRHRVGEEVSMFVCNTQNAGRTHPEADHLARYFRVVRFPANRTRHNGWKHEEEKENYAFCLESAAGFGAKYVLLLQDDALPHTDFYEVVDYLLQHRLERRIDRGQDAPGVKDWAWLKLNFPNELAAFHHSPYFVYDWIALSLIGASIASFIYLICTGQNASSATNGTLPEQKVRRRRLGATYNVFVLSFVYVLLASWLIGRPYFLRLYGLSKYFTRLDPGTSCCLPAVLYPQEQVMGLVQYLGGVKCKPGFPLDFALEAYREQAHLRQYLAVPNLFTHIGYYSALHGGSNSMSAYAFLDDV